MRHNQRGVIATFYLYAAAILAVTLALGGLYYVIDKRGYERGAAEIKRDWLSANEQAEKAATAARKVREAEAAKVAKSLASASNQARDFESRWRAARAAKPVLATVECTGNVASVPSTNNPDSNGIRLRFSTDFLRQWESAWSIQSGEQLFKYPDGVIEKATGTVTLDSVLDNHAENAFRCSSNSRQMNALIDLIERLKEQ